MSVTLKNEIGKVWAGTRQIGQIFAGNQLIYTARTPENPQLLHLGIDAQPDITGGWQVKTMSDNWYFRGYDARTQSIRLAQTGHGYNHYGWAHTAQKVNVSGWNRLVLRVETDQGYGSAKLSNGWVYIGLSETQDAPMTEGGVFSETVVKGTSYFSTNKKITEYYIEVDVADIDGDFYIFAGQMHDSEYGTYHCYIHDIYFVQ